MPGCRHANQRTETSEKLIASGFEYAILGHSITQEDDEDFRHFKCGLKSEVHASVLKLFPTTNSPNHGTNASYNICTSVVQTSCESYAFLF
jgi:hypothetical protein